MGTQAEGRLEVLRTRPCAVRCAGSGHVYRVYYAVRDEDGVLHWLGATKGTPEALSAREEANILWLAGDGPLPPSEAEVQADGTLDFTSGPLAHLRDLLEK